MTHLHIERDRTISSSSHATGSSPRPALPQPSFAPIPMNACAPKPTPVAGTITPKSSLYTCPIKHLSLRLASSRSTAFQSRIDPTTSFYLYLPTSHPVSRRWRGDVAPPMNRDGGEWDGYGEYKVVVLIHGSVRDAERLRNSWAERAEKEGVVIIAPLWAGRLDFPHGCNAYKYLSYPQDGSPMAGTRYDLTLFDILQQVKDDWGFLDIDTFGLAGFSGGGQFVHRLLYLHPHRISAVSIGAPGSCTLISPSPWPRGTLDTATIFEVTIDPSTFKSTAIQIIVGSEENDDGSEYPLSRYEIAVELHDNFTKHEIRHDWVVVEGGWHETDLFRPQVQDFVIGHLTR